MLADGLVLPLTVIDYLREFEDAVGQAISKRGKGGSRGQPKQRYKTYIVWTIYGLICQSESDKDKIVDFVHRVLIAGRVTRKREDEEDERTTTIGLIREAKKEYRGARK